MNRLFVGAAWLALAAWLVCTRGLYPQPPRDARTAPAPTSATPQQEGTPSSR